MRTDNMKNVSKLVGNSIHLLEKMFNESTSLFSFSARQIDGSFLNDFSNAGKFRYTLNVLFGLQKLQQHTDIPWDLKSLAEKFLSEHPVDGLSLGDRGLLLHILSLENNTKARQIYISIEDLIKDKTRTLKQAIQNIAWASIGITTYAKYETSAKGCDLARKAICYLCDDLMNSRTLLPRHNCGPRGAFISFGGIAYFLMAMEHYSKAFNDDYVSALFKNTVARVLALQGKSGEWPWFVDSSSGRVMDWYQIYSVHQDSMAMLFLLPAVDMGVTGSAEAIRKSYRYLFGNNQLQSHLIQNEPFFIFRSIRRKNRLAERPRRLLYSFANKIASRSAELADSACLEINKECRSYHLGWIVYAWAGRSDFLEFTELELLPGKA